MQEVIVTGVRERWKLHILQVVHKPRSHCTLKGGRIYMYELKLRDSLLIMFRFSYTFVFIKLKLFVRAQLFVGSFAQKKCLNFYNGNYYAQGHRTLIPFLGLIVLDFGLIVLQLYESQDSLWFFQMDHCSVQVCWFPCSESRTQISC